MSQSNTSSSSRSDETTQSVTMFIFVNSDLELPKGKWAAQVGHIVQLITEEIIRNGFEASGVPESYVEYIKWKQGGAIGTKIIKRASTAELQELLKLEYARGITDECFAKPPFSTTQKEQQKQKCLTVVGLFPSSKYNDIAEKFSLY